MIIKSMLKMNNDNELTWKISAKRANGLQLARRVLTLVASLVLSILMFFTLPKMRRTVS